MPSLRVWESNDVSLSSVSYLLVACGAEGVLDRVWWVAALLAAEAPLGRGVARATGHPGSGLSRAGFCCTDQGLRLSMAGDPNHLRKDRWWFHMCPSFSHKERKDTPGESVLEALWQLQYFCLKGKLSCISTPNGGGWIIVHHISSFVSVSQ